MLAAEHWMVEIQDRYFVQFARLGLPLALSVQVSCQFWRQRDAARGFDFQMALGCSAVQIQDPGFVQYAWEGPESPGIGIHVRGESDDDPHACYEHHICHDHGRAMTDHDAIALGPRNCGLIHGHGHPGTRYACH